MCGGVRRVCRRVVNRVTVGVSTAQRWSGALVTDVIDVYTAHRRFRVVSSAVAEARAGLVITKLKNNRISGYFRSGPQQKLALISVMKCCATVPAGGRKGAIFPPHSPPKFFLFFDVL